MQFSDSFYTYKIISPTSLLPSGYFKLNRHEVNHGALARYLISKAQNCPIFEQQLKMFCPKTEDLIDPYYTDLDEAYQRELSSRLAGLEVAYRKQSQGLFDNDSEKLDEELDEWDYSMYASGVFSNGYPFLEERASDPDKLREIWLDYLNEAEALI